MENYRFVTKKSINHGMIGKSVTGYLSAFATIDAMKPPEGDSNLSPSGNPGRP